MFLVMGEVGGIPSPRIRGEDLGRLDPEDEALELAPDLGGEALKPALGVEGKAGEWLHSSLEFHSAKVRKVSSSNSGSDISASPAGSTSASPAGSISASPAGSISASPAGSTSGP